MSSDDTWLLQTRTECAEICDTRIYIHTEHELLFDNRGVVDCYAYTNNFEDEACGSSQVHACSYIQSSHCIATLGDANQQSCA